jgi:hypothetical protein
MEIDYHGKAEQAETADRPAGIIDLDFEDAKPVAYSGDRILARIFQGNARCYNVLHPGRGIGVTGILLDYPHSLDSRTVSTKDVIIYEGVLGSNLTVNLSPPGPWF